MPTKEKRRTWAAINMYTVWNIWKERKRRTFEAREADPVGGGGVSTDKGGGQSEVPSVRNSSGFLVSYVRGFLFKRVSSFLCNKLYVRLRILLLLT